MKTTTPKTSRRLGCLKILGRGLAAVVLLLVVLAAVGYAYEHYAAARDNALYPPPGRLVEVDQHKVHLYCTGSGAPTVILEAAANSSSLDWCLVQPEIAKFTRVCSYDRAGFGWSELGPPPRTAQRAAEDLHSVLSAAGESGPYILVGASYGAHISRLFAHQYPAEVAGLVLADARPERLFSIPAIRQQSQSSLGISKVVAFLGEFGLLRPFIAWAPDKLMPAAALPYYQAQPGSFAIVFQAKFTQAMDAEAQAIDASDAEVAEVGSLGDLPLIVIRHGKPMFSSLPPAERDAMEQQWTVFQEEIARQSTAGKVIVAENSGHLMQLEQPQVIVEAVKQVLKQP